jgi:cyanate permease
MDLTFRKHDPTVALIHGLLLGITFAVLFPVSGALYCHLKAETPRIARNVHASIQCVGLLLAVVGTGLGISMVKSIVSNRSFVIVAS